MKYFLLFLALTLSLYGGDLRSKIDHIIVVYLENRSFNNLFRGFEGADTSDKPMDLYAMQIDRNGTLYHQLPMGEKSLQAGFTSTLPNAPFLLDTTVSQEGMIPDMVHRFYQNQLQINGGRNDRFVDISDEKGLTMGYHDISKSALWRYAKEFTLCDRFFAAAFGGSFLNHQWLIAARTPYVGLESNISRYELNEGGEIVHDGILTPDGYAVNTIQPYHPPFKIKYSDPSLRLKPLKYDTIGDTLSDKNISWSWYSGGFDDALSGKGDEIHYQYHHNPFLYFARYAPGAEGRQHLKDEKAFFSELKEGKLPSVVFFKPSARDNQHPGYASIKAADEKLSQIVEAVRSHPNVWNKSLIIVTYDENGGLWDHVAPPQKDRWGPGTRIPALLISPHIKKGFVDHSEYDTTSILRFIEQRYDLLPLGERLSNPFSL
ncbi:alkaline phosphatase family protein [Sulfuricurvum sp.]|uniref:alkaline phosphatase family protein n=1 Tax=Sulfuricurvum sp. TaxID=2025608 RepID=UPI003BB7B035